MQLYILTVTSMLFVLGMQCSDKSTLLQSYQDRIDAKNKTYRAMQRKVMNTEIAQQCAEEVYAKRRSNVSIGNTYVLWFDTIRSWDPALSEEAKVWVTTCNITVNQADSYFEKLQSREFKSFSQENQYRARNIINDACELCLKPWLQASGNKMSPTQVMQQYADKKKSDKQ